MSSGFGKIVFVVICGFFAFLGLLVSWGLLSMTASEFNPLGVMTPTEMTVQRYGFVALLWMVIFAVMGGAFQGAKDWDWELPGGNRFRDRMERTPEPQSHQTSGQQGPQPDEPTDATRKATYRVLFGEPTSFQPSTSSEASEQSSVQKPEPKRPAETGQSGDDISYRGEYPKRVRKEEKV